ncbi:MAG: DUF4350 domain-containing protein [Ferruginibacter sp.]
MKNKRTYLFLILLVPVVLTGCLGGLNAKQLPSLVETFSKKDSKPFGARIAYRQLELMYHENFIRDKKQAFTRTWKNITDTSSLYICIAPALHVNDEEIQAMMEYVAAGNELFISAGYIDPLLLEKIKCNEMYHGASAEDMFDNMKNTFSNSAVEPGVDYPYYYLPFQNYFFNIDSSNTRVIGYNEDAKANAIVYFHGKGKLFLHCDPRVFSNYFLLQEKNYKYLQNALAFTKALPEHLYWDDYYYKLWYRKNGKNDAKDFSTFSEIMKYPPLVYAFWISLGLLLLYILFGGKRLQRIIEQLKPNENTTVTFTETIGRLYLQKKDNKNIADKMVTYFNEYIRNKYFLNTNLINEDFITTLSRKAGVHKDKVETLYHTIASVHSSTDVNDYQLLSLHEQIQNFYKNKG